MFVSVLTRLLILRRLGLKVKMFPRHSRDGKKWAGCEARPSELFVFFGGDA